MLFLTPVTLVKNMNKLPVAVKHPDVQKRHALKRGARLFTKTLIVWLLPKLFDVLVGVFLM